MSCPQNGILGKNLTFTLQCYDSAGLAVDADGLPTYVIYENTTDEAIITGTMAKLDDAGTTGFYAAKIAITEDNGFELWKSYTIRYSAVISGAVKITLDSFNVISSAVEFSAVTGAFVVSETEICNMSLAKIGAKRINDIENDKTPEAIQCRIHYNQTRDALQRSFDWPFAMRRVILSESISAPVFEWGHQFLLPSDFLRFIKSYLTDSSYFINDRYAIEGDKFLTNDSSAQIVYVRKVINPAEFDPLFTEILVLWLARKLVNPLAGINANSLKQEISFDLRELMPRARAVCSAETNVTGRQDWSLARFGTGKV